MSVICKEFILLDTNYKSRDEAFKDVASKLFEEGRITDTDKFVKGVYEREKLFSTYMGNNTAIPHCKSSTINEATVIILRNLTLLSWGDEEEKANLLFMLAIPEDNANRVHLRILADIAQSLLNKNFVNIIKTTNSKETIINEMKNININTN